MNSDSFQVRSTELMTTSTMTVRRTESDNTVSEMKVKHFLSCVFGIMTL